ncbi:Putative LOC100168714, partial [Caligus rogercresseyi]
THTFTNTRTALDAAQEQGRRGSWDETGENALLHRGTPRLFTRCSGAVQQKKCDDISATYHLTEMSLSHSCSALEAPEDGALQEVYSEAAPLKAITSKIKFNSILPQTDLSLNLPLVGDQPLENFTVKNPHLLRPPDGLDSYFAHQGRRASDGGAYLIPPPPSSLQKEQEEASSSLAVPLLQPTSLRRRRSGGLQPVAEKSPDNPFSEVENRILDSGSWLSVGSLEAANYPPSTLRQRRTGLSTVMEGGKNASGLKDSLCLPYERFSPVRRSTESSSSSSTSPCSTGGGFHHRSTTPDPADIRALQEEYHSLQST